MRKKNICILFSLNVLLLGFLVVFVCYSFKDKDLFKEIETQQLIIRNPNNQASITMQFDHNIAKILITDEKGKAKINLMGGEDPSISLYGSNNNMICEVKAAADDMLSLLYSMVKKNRRFI